LIGVTREREMALAISRAKKARLPRIGDELL
jgi:hypothetical protein